VAVLPPSTNTIPVIWLSASERVVGLVNSGGHVLFAAKCVDEKLFVTTLLIYILLYSCEAWTIYRRHIHSLDKFHLRCLRQITGLKWQDKIPNTEILAHCKMTVIEAMFVQAQLRWSGHLAGSHVRHTTS